MAESEFELISDFFTDSGLKYLYRDFSNINEYIQSMKVALEILSDEGMNNHIDNVYNLLNIYEKINDYFRKVDLIEIPDESTYKKCISLHRSLQQRRSRGRYSSISLINKCYLYFPGLGGGTKLDRIEIEYKENLKIFDMIYKIIKYIRELKRKKYEFDHIHTLYTEAVDDNDDESVISDKIKGIVIKGSSIPILISEIERLYEKLYNDTNLSDNFDYDDDLSSIPSVTLSDNSQASTLILDLSEQSPVDDLEARLNALRGSSTTPSTSPEPIDDLEARLNSLRGGSKRVRRKKTLRKKNVRKTAKRGSKKKSNKRTYKKRTYKKITYKNN